MHIRYCPFALSWFIETEGSNPACDNPRTVMRYGDRDRTREPPAALRAINRMEPDFVALFDEYYDRIAAYFMRRMVDHQTAEDIAASTFCEAYDRRATYDPERGDPQAWLYGIAINLARRHFRSEIRRLKAYSRALSRETEAGDSVDEICGRVDAQSSAGTIAAALGTLSLGDYEVLTLHCWADLSHAEIAAALGIPEGTVKSRLNRARRKMRAPLNPSLAGDE
jgi:RNA polymerase sigma-70 factor, ECF subfamily